MNNFTVYNEKMAEQDRNTRENLDNLDVKLNMGFNRSVLVTSQKVQRASVYS